jgi:suppressor for copper-sensitivity B
MTFIAALRALIIGVACIAATATSVNAATSDWVGDARGEVRLVTAAESVNGDPIKVGIEFQYPPGLARILAYSGGRGYRAGIRLVKVG